MKKKTATQTKAKSRPVMSYRPESRQAQDLMLELFKESVESSSDAIGMSTPEGVHYYQNRAFDNLFGDIGPNPTASVYVDEEVGREVFATIMSGGQWLGEVEMKAKDGRVLNIMLRAYANKDASGKILGLVGVHTDITQLKKTEDALRKSEEHYRVLTETAVDAIITANGQGRIVSWNQGAGKIYGYKPEEIIGQDFTLLMPANQRKRHKKFFFMLLEKGEMLTKGMPREGLGCRKDGSDFVVESSFTLRWTDHDPFFTIIARDVSERKQLEKKLQESEELFRLNFENAPIGICIFDKKGALLQANVFCETCFGRSREDLMRQSLTMFLHPDDKKQTTETCLAIVNNHEKQKESFVLENRYFGKEGQTIYTKQHIQGAFNKDGNLQFTTVLTEDITATKQLTLMNEAIVHKLKEINLQLDEFSSLMAQEKDFVPTKSLSDYDLTAMETRIASMIFHGSPNKSIAGKLCISENTIKHHITSLYSKLKVKNRIDFINTLRTNRIII